MRSTALELFLRRAIPGEQGQCFEWPGRQNHGGYGVLQTTDKAAHRVHRLSYEYFVGPIPSGMLVRHSCDNPPCWNPDHLLVGTHQDNMNDAVARGRMPSSLTEQRAAEIRRVHAAEMRSSGWVRRGVIVELARRFSVSPHTIRDVVRGRRWKNRGAVG